MILEVPAAIKRATKYDLFTGDVDNLLSKHDIKENTTVFYRDFVTNEITGPHIIYSYSWFLDVYRRMAYGKLGILIPFPKVISNEFIFDLVLREASIDDVKDTPRHIKLNRLYYTYINKNLTGPLYINQSITSEYLENLIENKQLFIPHEKQHFKNKSFKKAV